MIVPSYVLFYCRWVEGWYTIGLAVPFVAVGNAREVNLLTKKPMVHHDMTILTMYYSAISTVNNSSEYRQDLKDVSVDPFVPSL